MSISDKLVDIYKRLCDLRNAGVKMKDIAEVIDFAPSVLSALYSTVLPIYIKTLENSSHEEALEYAISQVNNVSKKRLLSNLDAVSKDLDSFKPDVSQSHTKVPFVDALLAEVNHSETISGRLDGTYLSYSQSSGLQRELKIEPYLLRTSEDGRNLIVTRKNTSNSLHEGFGILKPNLNLYILFDESSSSYFAPVSLLLQLPFIELPTLIKGLYMCLDITGNPIARRIVLKKISDDTDPLTFVTEKSMLLTHEELDEEQKVFYEYTCQSEDALRMYALPSRNFEVSDLLKEKEICAILSKK